MAGGDLEGDDANKIFYGGGGSGDAIEMNACAGGGQGGGFGVGGGGGGFGYDVSGQIKYFAYGGGGGGGFGTLGGKGWQVNDVSGNGSSDSGSGDGGSGGQISVVNTLVPSSFIESSSIGLSAGNGGNGYGGGDGGNGGGVFIVDCEKTLTIENLGTLEIFAGLKGVDGNGDNFGVGGIGGGILLVGDISTGSIIVDKGGVLKIYAPLEFDEKNGGEIRIAKDSQVTVNGNLELYGAVRLSNKGTLLFGNESNLITDMTDISHLPLNMNAQNFITESVLIDDEKNVGVISTQNWMIKSIIQDPVLGQTASSFPSGTPLEQLTVVNNAYLFSTRDKPLSIPNNKILKLESDASLVIEEDSTCSIFGTLDLDSSATITNKNLLRISGILKIHQTDFTGLDISNWLETNSTLSTTTDFDIENVFYSTGFYNKDITWDVGGIASVGTARYLPSNINIQNGNILNYNGSLDQYITLSGSGLFKHEGASVLTAMNNLLIASFIEIEVGQNATLKIDNGSVLNAQSLTLNAAGSKLYFNAGAKLTGGVISLNHYDGNILINGGSDSLTKVTDISNDINITRGTLNMNGYINRHGNTIIADGVTLNIAKDTYITQDNGSTFSITGDQSISNMTISGGNILFSDGLFKLDSVTTPNVSQNTAVIQVSGISTFDSHTMGSHLPQNSYNAILMMPGSDLNITDTLILNNKNILIFGYDVNLTADSNASKVTYGHVIGGNSFDIGKFDSIYTLELNPDGVSPGILYPLDVRLKAQDIAIGFDVIETDTSIQYKIIACSEPFVGTNLDNEINLMLAANPSLRKIIDREKSSFETREANVNIDLHGSTALAESLINAISGASGIKTATAADSFYINGFQKNQSTTSRFEEMIRNMESQGPVSKGTRNYKYWHSPFVTFTKTKGETSMMERLLGVVIGTEYSSSFLPYTIGLLGGVSFSKQSVEAKDKSCVNKKGPIFGVYGSYGVWEGGRIDALYVQSLGNAVRDEAFNGKILTTDYRSIDTIFDIQASHLIKWEQNVWSLRFNVGHTYSKTENSYKLDYLKALPINTRRQFMSKSSEIYGGLGLRWNNKKKKDRVRITGVYEYGYQYQNINHNTISTPLNIKSEEVSGDKTRTHYVTFYGAYDVTNFWKFVGRYRGRFTKTVVEAGFFIKAVYRF